MNKSVIVILMLVMSGLLMYRFYDFSTQQKVYKDGQQVVFTARLTAVPEADGRLQRFSLMLPDGPRVFLSVPRFPTYDYGDILSIRGSLQRKQYENYAIFTMANPEIQIVPDGNVFFRVLAGIREQVSLVFRENLPPASASLLVGIVFGIKEGMPSEFEEALRTAGVMHVIAASGMNVSLVAGAVFVLFARFAARRTAIILSVAAIIFYAFLAGFEASIVRATIMAGIAFTASYFGRQYFGFLALVLTAYVMLLSNPGYLTDVGFQLSFLATLGILFVQPPEFIVQKERGDRRTKWYQGVVDDLRVTVAAQVATLPILLSTFGEYGLLSVPVNAIVLWTIPILMVFGSLAAACGLLLPILAKPLLFLALPFLLYFEHVVTWAGKLGYTFEIGAVPWPLLAGYYLILFGFVLLRQKRVNSGKLSESEHQKLRKPVLLKS